MLPYSKHRSTNGRAAVDALTIIICLAILALKAENSEVTKPTNMAADAQASGIARTSGVPFTNMV